MLVILPIVFALLAVVCHAVVHRFWSAVALVTAVAAVMIVAHGLREPASFAEPTFYLFSAVIIGIGFAIAFGVGIMFETRRQAK